MRCFIVGADGVKSRTQALSSALERAGFRLESFESLPLLAKDSGFVGAQKPLVLIPDSHSDAAMAQTAAAFAQDQSGHAFVAYIAETIAPDHYKRLIRSGAGEWIQWQTVEQELYDLAVGLAGERTSDRAAKVVCFLPSKGGVGNTSLVVEVAVQLCSRRSRGGQRVAILDLNLQGGTVADLLDLEPRLALPEIIDRPERLDEQLIDVFTSRHALGIDVFASPGGRMAPQNVSPDIIFPLIDRIAGRYDVILIDLPHHWPSWTDSLLEGSDVVIVTGHGTVPALRRLAATRRTIEQLGIPDAKVASVLNLADVDLIGRVSKRSEIARALTGTKLFYVRRDGASFHEAADSGRPVMELKPTSRVARDVRLLADWIETLLGRPMLPNARAGTRQGAAA